MNEKKKKSSAGIKVCIAMAALLDVFLVAAIGLVLLNGRISAGGKANLSDTFVANGDSYFERGEEEITPEEDTIHIRNEAAKEAEATQTPAPTVVPGGVSASGADANGFLFPESNARAIREEEMAAKLTDKDACRHAINEIYARHGYQFSNPEISEYFNQYDWYKNLTKEADMAKIDGKFSVIEKKNIESIQKYKAAKGW